MINASNALKDIKQELERLRRKALSKVTWKCTHIDMLYELKLTGKYLLLK
jgi:hypothetical protein